MRSGNNEVGGRLIEFGGAEYMVRGRGYAQLARPTSRTSCCRRPNSGHAGPRARTSADVALGPDIRRGVADLDGLGDAVSGIVVMRQGENALDVIERVKEKLREIEPALPPGVDDRHRPTTARS